MLADITREGWAGIVAGLSVVLGWLFAGALRRQDYRTFVFARAPQLPVRVLSVHDDAWLRGTVASEEPLACPWFGVPCVAYSYQIEDLVTKTRTVRGSDGKDRVESYEEWDLVRSVSAAIDFWLEDDEAYIWIAMSEGRNEAQASLGTDYEHPRRRHTAAALQLGEPVSVLGVKRDDDSFGPLAEVPLLVTYAEPKARVAAAHAREKWLFFWACLLPFVGGALGVGIWQHAATWQQWLAYAPAGLVLWLPQWWLLSYNRLVRLRGQVTAAQRQVDVELAMRSDLVPNLVTVVQTYAGHEQALLAELAEIRSTSNFADRVANEAEAVRACRQLLALHEQYPKLLADDLYRDLHDRLWAIEEKLAHARGAYSDVVTEWNTRLATFPSALVGRSARMQPSELFAAECEAALPPRLVS